jgi:hypothetical protein
MILTESMAERVIGAFAAGADWALAARLLCVPRSSLRRAIEVDPDLLERVNDARAQADEVVIKSLYTRATVDKDTTAMIFWLKNRRPTEWRDRREIGPSSADLDAAVRRAAIEMGVSPDEVLELAKKIAADAAAFSVSADRKVQ